MTLPTRIPDPGIPQAPKPKQITREKLCFTKSASNFSWAVPGPGWEGYDPTNPEEPQAPKP